ncbi:alpha/beta hydrolase [Candidatus Woesearchaeota archaeon]|jgi:pimeloyl-ACP methyl ester carboxylesterase|nr:alpha/beta hydrolase [Candidatus Woesearchaeota archaeon]
MKSFDKTDIHYVYKKGNQVIPTLIFLHGWGHNYTVWNKEIDYFNKVGYNTIALDLRGHGKSGNPKKLSAYSMESFAKDVNHIIKKEKIELPVLIGHSLGGMIVLKFMELFPKKAKSIILIDTTYRNPWKDSQIIKQIKLTNFNRNLFKHIFENRELRKKHFKEVDFSKMKGHNDFFYFIRGLRMTPTVSILACLKDMLNFDESNILSNIKIPTLIIEGKFDYKTPMNVAREMHKKIKDSKLVIINKGIHDTNIINPTNINKEIDKFLTGVFDVPETDK